MKFSKTILFCSALLLSASLRATEPKEKSQHTTYMGYESRTQSVSYPIFGYRFQKESIIFDVNGGYKHIKTPCGPWNVWKAGANIYKVLNQAADYQTYIGFGADLVGVKTRAYNNGRQEDYGLHPSFTIGNDFNLSERKKIFFEFVYKPFSFGKYDNKPMHSTGFRVGVGF